MIWNFYRSLKVFLTRSDWAARGVAEPGTDQFRVLGSRQEIITHLACFLARLQRYIHQHISRYAPADVPYRRTKILRNLV